MSEDQHRGPLNEPLDEHMTPRKVADLFQVTTATITRWADEGKLPAIRTLGGHRRFPRARIEEIARQMRAGNVARRGPDAKAD